jgi:pimeloyl-ACP methyl ester carboxylesterase
MKYRAFPAGNAEPPTPSSRWAEVNGAVVHCLDTAPESDFLVLLVLPGFLGSTATFLEMAAALSGELRAVIPDLPLVPQQTLVLQSRIPSCATWRREGCRHIVQLDAPAEVAGLIARFCATGLTPAAW